MTSDLSMFHVVAHSQDGAPELNCSDHPGWWSDADGTNLPDVIRAAVAHFRDAHRVHVDGCACADRVLDQRCVPHLTMPSV